MSSQAPIGIEGALRMPGLLLQPFQWAAEPLMRLALAEPRLLAHLTDLTALRLHVITFYLAVHGDDCDDSATAAFLSSARSRNILERALARPPGRLLGLLRRLPDQAMSIATYKQLAAITSNVTLVNIMMKQSKLRGIDIERLAKTPPVLLAGPLQKVLASDLSKLAAVVETVAWFAHRWSIEVTDRFAAVRSLAELSQLTSELLRTLPAVPRLPPLVVGHAKMIETHQELARAARTGRNCLGSYATQIAQLKCAIYIWDDGDEPIYIEVKRKDELGWFVADMKIANNRSPPEERRKLVDHAFDVAGIDSNAVAINLNFLLLSAYGDLW